MRTAETVYIGAVRCTPTPQELRDRRLDRILTSRRTGFPLMLLLLLGVFWLTITGANVPSQLLADGLFWVGDRLGGAMAWAGAPVWVKGLLVDGVYRVLAWVVSVMLPPMAIFFPLFTLLEDLGYLPRLSPWQWASAATRQGWWAAASLIPRGNGSLLCSPTILCPATAGSPR